LDRFIFLLRLSRARAHSDIFVDWNLGNRQSRRGGVENHNLSYARQFRFADRTDSSLPELAAARAHVRHPRVTGIDSRASNRRFRTTPYLPVVADRIRDSDLALSVSFLGAGRLRVSAAIFRDAARRRSKKIRPLRFAT